MYYLQYLKPLKSQKQVKNYSACGVTASQAHGAGSKYGLVVVGEVQFTVQPNLLLLALGSYLGDVLAPVRKTI